MTRHTTETDERVLACSAAALDSEAFDLLDAHAKELGGGFAIRRALPVRERRMIGPFCFLDHIGPAQLGPDGASMRIAPHPHIGLQTVTWLLEGTVLHRDSLGYRQPIRPGQLNVMTSGRGISHSEETLEDAEGTLHGVQLWVALPDHERHREPAFEHHADVPSVEIEGARGWLFHGSWQGKQAPGSHYSPLLALDLALDGAPCELALDSAYEHGIVVLEGSIEVSGQAVAIGELLYVRPGLERLCLTTNGPARVLVVGGPPFDEEILMWWNYVARTRDEIVEARRLWEETGTFGQVPGWGDERLSAPRILPAEPRSPDGASGSKAR